MTYATEFRLLADQFLLRAESPRLVEDAKQAGGVLLASAVRDGLLPELDFIRNECETLGDEHDPPLLEFKAVFIFTTALSAMSDRVNPLAVRWGGRSDGVLFGTTDANSWESQKETAIAFCRLMSERFEQTVAPVTVAADPQKEIRAEVLAAVVSGGLAGMTQAAVSLPAGDRAAEVMRTMCANNAKYYSWTADEWANHLKASKPTITGCDAWLEIMQWRSAKKQSAMPVKTATQKAESSRRKQHKKLPE